MTVKNEISEELRMLSEVVAGISRVTPYAAPGTGYFEAFPDLVLSQVSEPLSTVLQGLSKDPANNSVFGAPPAGYFEDLASNILNRVRAGQTGAGPGGNGSPLSAADELAGLSPFLSSICKKLPFQVPEGYFEGQLAQLTATLSGSLEEGSTLLAGLRQNPTYQAPEGYFGQFPDSMLAKVGGSAKAEKAAPARVISMGRKQSWWRLPAVAAAASVILVIGWLGLHTPGTKPENPAGNPDITKSLPNVSDTDIQNYLDNQNIPLADQLANSTASVDITDTDETSMLGDVSDTELKQYLEDHGNAKDSPMN